MAVTDEHALQTFATRLNELMDRHGVTQSTLARGVNESNTRIANYRLGRKMPGVGVATRIADFFGVSVTDLVTEKNIDKKRRRAVN